MLNFIVFISSESCFVFSNLFMWFGIFWMLKYICIPKLSPFEGWDILKIFWIQFVNLFWNFSIHIYKWDKAMIFLAKIVLFWFTVNTNISSSLLLNSLCRIFPHWTSEKYLNSLLQWIFLLYSIWKFCVWIVWIFEGTKNLIKLKKPMFIQHAHSILKIYKGSLVDVYTWTTQEWLLCQCETLKSK